MPDAYWSQWLAERDAMRSQRHERIRQRKARRQRRKARRVERRACTRQHELGFKYAKTEPHAWENRRRWPTGHWQVFNALHILKIPFRREFVIATSRGYFQVDFLLQRDGVILEIDGPEHVERHDRWRERIILGTPLYANCRFVRIKSEEAFDEQALFDTLAPLARNDSWDAWDGIRLFLRRE